MKNLHIIGNPGIWHKQLPGNRYLIWYKNLHKVELIKVNFDDTIDKLKQVSFEPDITIKEFSEIIESITK